MTASTSSASPTDDVIVPSVLRVDQLLTSPLGRYYMYYAPHDAPGGISVAHADRLEGPRTEYPRNPLIERDWPPHHRVSHVSGPHVIWSKEERKLFLYLMYHPHQAERPEIADLHVSEVDPALEHPRHLGVLYSHTSVSPDNVAQMSPCLVEEDHMLYLFTNIGPRRHQKIALAVAPARQ